MQEKNQVLEALSTNQTVLVLVDGTDYNDAVLAVIKGLSGSVGYVTLNKTSDALRELFKKNGVKTKSIVFVDAISKTFKDCPPEGNGVYYMSSPAAMTEISLAISKLLNHGFKYIIFDSLTNLLVYQGKAPVAKFVSQLTNSVRASKSKAVFYSLKVKEHEELIEETKMFVDKVVTTSQVTD
jgi:hypothetical protein